MLALLPLVGALLLPGGVTRGAQRGAVARMQATDEAKSDAAFGASHTSFYTDAVKQDKYFSLEEVGLPSGTGAPFDRCEG